MGKSGDLVVEPTFAEGLHADEVAHAFRELWTCLIAAVADDVVTPSRPGHKGPTVDALIVACAGGAAGSIVTAVMAEIGRALRRGSVVEVKLSRERSDGRSVTVTVTEAGETDAAKKDLLGPGE